jgi:hypothetical protein
MLRATRRNTVGACAGSTWYSTVTSTLMSLPSRVLNSSSSLTSADSRAEPPPARISSACVFES